MTTQQKENIQLAIKAQKWLKSDYGYAIVAMNPYSAYSIYCDSFKKDEVIAKFWELVETKFDNIKNFTTFKNI